MVWNIYQKSITFASVNIGRSCTVIAIEVWVCKQEGSVTDPKGKNPRKKLAKSQQ